VPGPGGMAGSTLPRHHATMTPHRLLRQLMAGTKFSHVPLFQIALRHTSWQQVSRHSSYLCTRRPKKPKGNMSRGSISSCFRVPLVARKNISFVSLWALQVSIGGALLVAREYKTANVRKKIGRSKALRMCPVTNVCPPQHCPSHGQQTDIPTFVLCRNRSWELLPKELCLN